MLAQGHNEYQFRYFEKSFNTASFSSARNGVAKLAEAVEGAVEKERQVWEEEAKAAGRQIVRVATKVVVTTD